MMEVRLWGVRGSLPTPMGREEYRDKLLRALRAAQPMLARPEAASDAEILAALPPELKSVIGGETTCLEIRSGDAELIIDMGAGARRLGLDMEARDFRGEINILLTHTHWDHIQGFPHFLPAFRPENTLHFYSCLADLDDRFLRQQHADHFRVRFNELPGRRIFHTVEPGVEFAIGPFTITGKPLIHPGGSIAYKIECGGRTLIFATDTEFYGPDLHQQMDDYYAFFHHADLLIMDAQYSLEEAEQKRGWGHTAMTIAVDCSLHWKVKELVLTHHEPAHGDDAIWRLFQEADEYLSEFSSGESSLKIHTAREGDVYRLD